MLLQSDEEEPDPYNYHENYGSGGTGGYVCLHCFANGLMSVLTEPYVVYSVFHRGRLVYSRLTPASAMIVPLRLILAEEVHADWNELQKEIDCFSCPVDDLETPYDVQRLRDSPLAKLPSAIGLGYGRLDEASAAHWWQPEWSANISPPPMFLEEPEPAFEHEAPPLFHPIPVSARNLASVPLLEAHSSLWREAASYPACTLGCSLPDDLKPSSEPEESDWPTMPLGTAGQLDGDDDAIRYARSTAKHELHDELHDDAYYDSEVDAYIPLHLRRKGPRDLELATTRQKRKSQIHPWKARVRREKNERAQFESDGIMDTVSEPQPMFAFNAYSTLLLFAGNRRSGRAVKWSALAKGARGLGR